MHPQYDVVIGYNEHNDRWYFRIKGVRSTDMYYPYHRNGTDEYGYEQQGGWNEATQGWLDEICDCLSEDIRKLVDEFYEAKKKYNAAAG